jgi:hypothetical protein
MRVFVFSVAIAAMVGCAKFDNPDEQQPPEKAAAVELRAADRGVRITFDRATDEFTLENGTNRTIWFDGRKHEGPAPSYQRLTPEGWATTWVDWCGTNREMLPLAPGERIGLGWFETRVNRGASATAKKYRDKLHTYPARVALAIAHKGDGEGVTIYSETIDPPRQPQ